MKSHTFRALREMPLIELVELIFDDIEISCRHRRLRAEVVASPQGLLNYIRSSNYKTLLAVRIPRWRVGA